MIDPIYLMIDPTLSIMESHEAEFRQFNVKSLVLSVTYCQLVVVIIVNILG